MNNKSDWMFKRIIPVLLILLIIGVTAAVESTKTANIRPNVAGSFNPTIERPVIAREAYIDPMASVIGNVEIGSLVYVAPFASIRGDEGQAIHIGENTNIQDGVVLHALETQNNGEVVEKNLVEDGGKKYAVYIGNNVSLAHQSQVHGPAIVDDGTFIGMQALVFKARVGKNVVVEPGAILWNGVTIADGCYVPAGMVVSTQEQADKLPKITDDYPLKDLNKGVLHVNEQLAEGYLELQEKTLEKEEAAEREAMITPVQITRTPRPTEKAPGFGGILVMGSIVAVYLCLLRRR
jgi:carbonic anhydrase/acetyltransferase-like protein (isoleucine patch superfamily)